MDALHTVSECKDSVHMDGSTTCRQVVLFKADCGKITAACFHTVLNRSDQASWNVDPEASSDSLFLLC